MNVVAVKSEFNTFSPPFPYCFYKTFFFYINKSQIGLITYILTIFCFFDKTFNFKNKQQYIHVIHVYKYE